MKKHLLYEINLESQTAFCTICGYTEIYIPKTRTRRNPKVMCINKAKQRKQYKLEKYFDLREEKCSQPSWHPRHLLTEIDPVMLTAICAVCGPTDIYKTTNNGLPRYNCATKHREYMRTYKRSHYTPRSSNPHALTEIDEEKGTAVCAKCGPVKIEFTIGNKKITRRCTNVKKELFISKKTEEI